MKSHVFQQGINVKSLTLHLICASATAYPGFWHEGTLREETFRETNSPNKSKLKFLNRSSWQMICQIKSSKH